MAAALLCLLSAGLSLLVLRAAVTAQTSLRLSPQRRSEHVAAAAATNTSTNTSSSSSTFSSFTHFLSVQCNGELTQAQLFCATIKWMVSIASFQGGLEGSFGGSLTLKTRRKRRFQLKPSCRRLSAAGHLSNMRDLHESLCRLEAGDARFLPPKRNRRTATRRSVMWHPFSCRGKFVINASAIYIYILA